MDPKDSSEDDPEGDFLENTIEGIIDTMSSEELKDLLTDTEAWKTYVADMPRDEADTLYEALCYLTEDTSMEDKQEKEFRENFLKVFPQMKQQLEEQIAQFHALADKADNLHRKCTISNVVANSTGIVSGIMTIAGLTLAPVTAGASLTLTAAGAGLGAASAVTSVTTSIVEHVKMSSVKSEASALSSDGDKVDGMFKEILQCAPKTFVIGNRLSHGMNGIKISARAIKLLKSNPRLASRAARFVSGGKISSRGARQVQKALAGTPLAMTKGARIFGTVFTGITLVMDVYSLVENSKELQEGAKTESAEYLRQQAQERVKKLEELTQFYKSLQ